MKKLIGALFILPTVILKGQSSILFPATAADLPAKTYWSMDGDHGGSNARDLGIRRILSNGSSKFKEGTTGEKNSDYLVYGAPLYAPADGEIVACWCNSPDNPAPGVPDINRCCDGDCETSCDDNSCPSSFKCRIARSGNYVVILTKENNLILLAHLKPGSIPSDLCPNKNIYFQNARIKTSGLPNESILPVNKRIKVKAGDFVGRAGNCGASSGPHLHIHTVPVTVDPDGTISDTETTIPTLFRNTWVSKNNGTDWEKLKDQPVSKPPVLIHPSPFLRRDDDDGAGFNEISLDGSVMALSNEKGNLQIISYGVNNTGVLTKLKSEEGGSATKVKLIHFDPNSPNAITAFRTATGNLKLIAWQIISANGNITRKGEETAGPVTDIAISRFPDGKGCFTAVKSADDNLKLIAWEISPTLSITRRGEIEAGNVKNFDISSTSAVFRGAITATTGSDDKLKLIAWQFNEQTKTFTRKGDEQAGIIKGKLQITRVSISGKDIVVTACKDMSDNLKLISWEVSANGEITRKESATTGNFEMVELIQGKNGNIITVLKDNSGNLSLIAWKVYSNGKIEYAGKENAGAVEKISSSFINRDGRDFLLTGVRTGSGKLRMISWETNLK